MSSQGGSQKLLQGLDQRYISTSTRPDNSVGNTKHRKTYKSKTFFDYLKILIFDLYQHASIKNFPGK